MSLVSVSSVLDENFDVVIFINDTIKELGSSFVQIEDALSVYERVCSLFSSFLLCHLVTPHLLAVYSLGKPKAFRNSCYRRFSHSSVPTLGWFPLLLKCHALAPC